MFKWRDHNSQRWQSWFWTFLIVRASLLTSSPSEIWPYLSMTNRPLYGYPAPEDIVISHLPDDYGLGWVYWKWIHTEAGSPIRRMDQLLRNWTSIWTRNLRSLLRELAGWPEILSSLLGLAVYFQTPREVHEKCRCLELTRNMCSRKSKLRKVLLSFWSSPLQIRPPIRVSSLSPYALLSSPDFSCRHVAHPAPNPYALIILLCHVCEG